VNHIQMPANKLLEEHLALLAMLAIAGG